MHQFGWLSERGSKFFNLLQKEGVSLRKGKGGMGVPTLEETVYHQICIYICMIYVLLNVFDSFIHVIMLNVLRFKSSILLGTHTLLDKSLIIE